ncbi:uncharacterized protein LOC122357433 [Puntigrus tetrazona]|uniref:uncharacterized protein LOC122357433 n=1 Tax=Puntigrus tetrazona TaxID=1606681 RepID=UPI001C8ADB2A|nr:uncharacterized protein LOC122357433 [Puntigrus tetrazona]
MLTFETLLVKQLQKQQSRAEFCDIVLQTGDVSVPVHSCVLSAFSPWLCGALSAMPSPRNGQRRLIEVQAVESCTLLSLVSLLYSGQLSENKEEVLSAACKLGINMPQQVPKRPATERNTQTECMKEVAERECQTEAVPSECQNPKEAIESVNLIRTSSWTTVQGLCPYTDGSDTTLQSIQGDPGNIPSIQVVDVVPEIAERPTAGGSACLPKVYDTAPPQRRRRGRPLKHPLPKPDVPQNFSRISPPDQKTSNPSAPSLLHTTALPAANQTGLTQPMDWLLDDVIAQLPFMPSNQNGIIVDSSMDHTRTQSSVKLADLGIIQSQAEGELTDILDSFLRMFEQHVGICDPDVQDGMVPSVTDGSRSCGQSYTVHTNSVNTTRGAEDSLTENRPRVSSARRSQKPSSLWQVSGVKMEKPTGLQSELKTKSGRMTRSQSRKRKLDGFEELPGRDELPAKRKRKRQKEQTVEMKLDSSLPKEKKSKKKTSRLHSKEKCLSGTDDSSCSVASALSKVINMSSGQNVNTQTLKSLGRLKSSVSNLVKQKQVEHAKRKTAETFLEGNTLKEQCSTGRSQPKLSAVRNASTRSCPTLSAFDLMKNILENHQKMEEEHKGKDSRMWTVENEKGSERLTNTHERGDVVKLTENKEKNPRIRVKENNISRINQEDKERSGNQRNIFLQQNLASANGCSVSKGERLMEDGKRCSTESILLKNTTEKSFFSHEQNPTIPLEKLGNSQGSIAISDEDEDVDVAEVSSSLSESFSVLPITADVLSTEDSEENDEIDVISLGCN